MYRNKYSNKTELITATELDAREDMPIHIRYLNSATTAM